MKPPPPLNYIRSFECSARHLSFTLAASELGYTQAAVSNHVRGLEHYLGRQLFVRYPRSLKLTEMGEAFLPTLRQALDQIDHATEAIVASSRNRTVVISCPMSLAENWLAGCMGAFRQVHPEIEVVLHGTIWEDLSEQIADITISTRRFDDLPPGAVQLWSDQLAILCAPSLLSGPKALKAPSDILGVDWIFVHGRQEYWQCMGDALQIDISDYEKGITTNASNIALELAAMGAGCVATQYSLARTYIARGLLMEPFPVRAASPWTYYLSESQLSKGNVVKIVRNWTLEQAALHMREPVG
ncbi:MULTISPECIES: LysR substrate-binding domain-containing protein [unclassified Mesorhizobium]|uniref:LysR substrate-binding domain-containing protein n=1 Tax=unclassified Mesorhizobium TaxID=325217 RepID=UPI0011263390|nr:MULTISPECIES: LysR substrate-binding domain-containing protein [unclassified Mesorhizobium]MBZ9810235.1 LysR family transcriptional regulator [Mesorhizobium sp. ESP-6-2]TPM29457.1 LysR family transcriptional regulator [Mesorhizobium sp. B2-2-2]